MPLVRRELSVGMGGQVLFQVLVAIHRINLNPCASHWSRCANAIDHHRMIASATLMTGSEQIRPHGHRCSLAISLCALILPVKYLFFGAHKRCRANWLAAAIAPEILSTSRFLAESLKLWPLPDSLVPERRPVAWVRGTQAAGH